MRLNNTLLVAAVFLFLCAPALAQAQESPEDEAITEGEAVYTYWCATCHSAGPRMPGTSALQAKYNGSVPAVLTERTDLTPEMITFYVRSGVSVMPPFRKTEVTDADLEAMAEYLTSRMRSD